MHMRRISRKCIFYDLASVAPGESDERLEVILKIIDDELSIEEVDAIRHGVNLGDIVHIHGFVERLPGVTFVPVPTVHAEAVASNTKPEAQGPVTVATAETRQHCKFWINSRACQFGDNCEFYHATDSEMREARAAWLETRLQLKRERAQLTEDPLDPHGKTNKYQRASVFVDWLVEKFGKEMLSSGAGVVDIAGGRGNVSFELWNKRGIPSTLIDPRPMKLSRMQYKFFKKQKIDKPAIPQALAPQRTTLFNTTTFLEDPSNEQLIQQASVLIGMHPDEATDAIIDVALRFNKPFALVPCCVFGHVFTERRRPDGVSKVVSFDDLVEYLEHKHSTIQRDFLRFDGKNLVLYRENKETYTRAHTAMDAPRDGENEDYADAYRDDDIFDDGGGEQQPEGPSCPAIAPADEDDCEGDDDDDDEELAEMFAKVQNLQKSATGKTIPRSQGSHNSPASSTTSSRHAMVATAGRGATDVLLGVRRPTLFEDRIVTTVKQQPETLAQLKQKIVVAAPAKPRSANVGRKFALDEEEQHCRFRPKAKRGAGSRQTRDAYDDDDAGNGRDRTGDFIARMEAAERNRQKKLEMTRGEKEYNANLNKKICPKCQVPQSYSEFRDKKKRCQTCGSEFRVPQAWGDIRDSFMSRMSDHSKLREERQDQIRTTVIAEETAQGRVTKSTTQQLYEKQLQQRHEHKTFLDRNYSSLASAMAASPKKVEKAAAREALAEKLREERKKLTLFRRPLSVLYHFSIVFARFLQWLTLYVLQHNATRFVLLPLAAAWGAATLIEGDHHRFLDEINTNMEFVVWWFGLGVLSSVGLGTGMHSGILFLFPHIFMVVQGAEACKSLNFDSRRDMWFRAFATECNDATPGLVPVTFFGIFCKVFWPCMLWGAGTAAGEIPPYALSRAARLAGQRNAEFEEITESKSQYNVLNWMKDWMIKFLEKHGFWGVLLMSAWPNVAFDLCGICCGHFLMPFWTFFGATLIGKALIKVNLQAAFFITIFTDAHMKQVEAFIASVTPAAWALDSRVSEFLLECREKFHSARAQASIEHAAGGAAAKSNVISQLGSFVMVAFIGYFAISCIEQFAQQHAAEEDEEKLKKVE
ncbi:hypothetical protein P43SY_009611 [Pythium insidiosum]|uniref:C3H1-type domain-containing protein n=1 Tax=Pythium insidiosum TaxID=114742 RepID=A0AAD5LQ35_PYTIN|nr:hypothetical protein P43SY_009611 [Pythium insidiosum]